MNTNLDVLNIAQSLASHASSRQSVVAANIANADTPGYLARDVRPFSETLARSDAEFTLRSTRHNHINASDPDFDRSLKTIIQNGEISPNGNSVSLEQEMTKSVELKHHYDMALGVYRKSMDILRISLGK